LKSWIRYDVLVKKGRKVKGANKGKEWFLRYNDGSTEWLDFGGADKVKWRFQQGVRQPTPQEPKQPKQPKLPKPPKIAMPPPPPPPPPPPKPGASIWKKKRPHLQQYFGKSTVSIRSFERASGGSGAVPSKGAFALGIGWKYQDAETVSLEDFENKVWYSDAGNEMEVPVPKKSGGTKRIQPLTVKDGRRVRRRYPSAPQRGDEKLPKLVEVCAVVCAVVCAIVCAIVWIYIYSLIPSLHLLMLCLLILRLLVPAYPAGAVVVTRCARKAWAGGQGEWLIVY
jgi:hypothetical protein